ncbi:unnamed protein product, partial [Brassica oleracea]
IHRKRRWRPSLSVISEDASTVIAGEKSSNRRRTNVSLGKSVARRMTPFSHREMTLKRAWRNTTTYNRASWSGGKGTSAEVKHMKVWLLECKAPSQKAFVLGIIALVCLAAAHIFAVMIGCSISNIVKVLAVPKISAYINMACLSLTWIVAIAGAGILTMGIWTNRESRSKCGFTNKHFLSFGGKCLIVCYKPELKECLLPLRPTSELNLRDADASSSSAFGRNTFLELMSWILRNVDNAYVLGFLLISLKTLK